MKKIFGLMMLSLVALLPLSTRAAVKITPNCGQADASGVITCTVAYNITDEEGVESISLTLTEKGGAEVVDVVDATGSEWSVSSKNEDNNVWTVILASIGVTGEGNLFTFSYRPSGTEDCEVAITLDGQQVPVTPPTTPETPSDPDTPTDNKQTGATLPYIALGAIAVIATGAYLATRNKAKMYKI